MTFKFNPPDLQKNKLYIISLILILKGCQCLYFIYQTQCSNPEIKLSTLALASGDTFSYTGAMENYIQKGTYFFFNGKENVYAGRLPHYSIPYLCVRIFFSQAEAYNFLVFFQLIIECLATYYLVLLLFCITNNKTSSYTLLVVCLIASNITQLACYISPESLSCSLLIFFVYNYYTYLKNPTDFQLFVSGVFLGLLITLKAYFIILYIPIGFHFLFKENFDFKAFQQTIVKSLLVVVPLLLLLGPWTVRNYGLYKKFIPLQINATAGYNYNSADLAFRRFVSSWGGDFIYWEKTSAGCYFIPNPSIKCEFKMPSYAYTSQYNASDIKKVRAKYISLQNNHSEILENEVANDFNSLTKSFISERPFEFYIYAPLRLAKIFLVHSGSYYLPIHSGNPCFRTWQLGIKIIQSLLYWISICIGMPGTILLAYRSKNYILPFVTFGIIILFPVILHVAEARYFRTIEPLLYLTAVYAIKETLNRFF